MFAERVINVHDVGLNIARGLPTGPPLMMLHGVLRCWADFLPILPCLSQRWEITAIDFRGHGESGFTPGSYRVADYVADAVAVLKDQWKEPGVIYGHSLGAMVAAAAAAEVPDRVRGLILEDPPLETMGSRIRETPFHSQFVGIKQVLSEEKSVQKLATELADIEIRWPLTGQTCRLGDLRDGASLRFSAKCLSQIDAEVLDPIIDGSWLEGYDWRQKFAAVRCPTLLLQGDPAVGGMLTDDDAAQIRRLVTDCVLIRFPQVGHLIHWMACEATARAMLPFLESLR